MALFVRRVVNGIHGLKLYPLNSDYISENTVHPWNHLALEVYLGIRSLSAMPHP